MVATAAAGRNNMTGQADNARLAKPEEIVELMRRLGLAIGMDTVFSTRENRLIPKIELPQMETYVAGLADIPFRVLAEGFKRIAGQHRFSRLPALGTIRSACVDAVNGDKISGSEAWALARTVLQRYSRYAPDASRALLENTRPDVRDVLRNLGVVSLQEMESDRARELFIREFEKSNQAKVETLGAIGHWPAALCRLANDSPKKLEVK